MDTITAKIYEGEKCKERLLSSHLNIERLESLCDAQALVISIDSTTIDSLSVEAGKVPVLEKIVKRLRKVNIGQTVALVVETVVIIMLIKK